MADNIQSKINKKNAKSQSGILNWIGSFFEGPTEYHKKNKRKAENKAKQLITNANKENKAVSLTSLKKDIKEAVPLKGRDFEKPIKPKAKNKTKPKDIGDADIKSKVGEYTGEGRKRAGFWGLTEKVKPLSDKLYNPRSKSSKATVSPNQKSRQASLPKDKDSFGSRLAKALGDKRSKKEMVRDREMI